MSLSQQSKRSVAMMSALWLALLITVQPFRAAAQVYSGSSGADGALDYSSVSITTNIVIDMHSHTNGVYQYSYVNIPANVTITFITNAYNSPVTWLVQSDVTINGSVNLVGGPATGTPYPANPCYQTGGASGPGGWPGGNGGMNGPGPGGGIAPGGGGFGSIGGSPYGGTGGSTYGNAALVPLVGGSGGGGGGIYGSGGGGAGGAIFIATPGSIQVNGLIDAHGDLGFYSGGGSGGAIKLMTANLSGSGQINCGGNSDGGGLGRVRIGALQNTFTGTITGVSTLGFDDPTNLAIITQPSSQTNLPGTTVVFSVGIFGVSPIYFQWYFTNAPIAGATNQSLVLTNISGYNLGIYSVVVSNAVKSIVSSNAFLSTYDTSTPLGDGIPNWWKSQYGLSLTDTKLATNYPTGDKLTYLEKYLYGLNPLTNDTDGDGLTDYDEIFIYHTNPLLASTASDGIPDGWKVQYGLNPLVAVANNEAGFDGVTYMQVYQYDLTHTNQLNPNNPFAAGQGFSNYEIINGGQHTNTFYYDHEDRLIGMESSHGISIGYKYDGNGNLLRQSVLSRAAETNGLPVLWLWLNGLTNQPGIIYANSDSDGWNNYQEWLAGTDPNNPQSVPSLLNNPGTNIASLVLPFTPSNFVEGVGNLDGLAGDEIVVGADGNPGTNNNYLLILTQNGAGWSTQKISVGSFGITSIAVGQPTNRPSAGIYVGLRGTNGSGQVMEFINIGGIWQSNLIVASTNSSTFVLGARNLDLLASLSPTNGPAGALYSLSFSNSAWNQNILSTNASHRISGSVGIVAGGVNRQSGFRLLDGSGIEISDLGKEFLGNRSLIPSNSVYYAKTDKWYFQTTNSDWGTTESACQSLGYNLVTINSADENQWLHTTFPFAFHIGYYGIEVWNGSYWTYGSWQWISGSPVTYRQWGTDPSGVNLGGIGYPQYPAYMGSDGSWNVERLYYDIRPGVGDLSSAGGLSVLPEPSAANRLTRNTSLLPCYTRPNQTNGFSILYAYVDDKNASGAVDVGDDFVLEELLVVTNGWTTNTLDRKTLTTTSLAATYGIATADLTGSNFKLPFTAEPDGQVFYWTATNSTASLQRNLFSSDYLGNAWHGLTGVKTSGLGQGLAGLMVSPTNQNVCNVIFWSPQTVLPTPQPSLIETAPSAAVIPSANPLGSNAVVTVRLWDNEGNASTPFLQYQILGASTWQTATLTTLDGAAYNPAARVTALPTGNNHTLGWNALADFGANIVTNILLRASAQDFMLTGNWSSPTPFQLNTMVATVSNPTNPPVNFTGFTRVQSGIGLNWQSGSNALLYLQRSPALAGTNAVWVNIWTGAPPTLNFGSYTDFFGTNPMEFYRMKIVNP